MNHIEKKNAAAAQVDAINVNPVEGSDLNGAFEEVGARVSEIAKQGISEDQNPKTGGHTATDEDLLQSKATFRDSLLASAPSERIMRSQIIESLKLKKRELEKQLSRIDGKDYNLFEDTLRELRKVIKLMQMATIATLDVLKEMWLAVVHNFN